MQIFEIVTVFMQIMERYVTKLYSLAVNLLVSSYSWKDIMKCRHDIFFLRGFMILQVIISLLLFQSRRHFPAVNRISVVLVLSLRVTSQISGQKQINGSAIISQNFVFLSFVFRDKFLVLSLLIGHLQRGGGVDMDILS
jgi:hypothetical protein